MAISETDKEHFRRMIHILKTWGPNVIYDSGMNWQSVAEITSRYKSEFDESITEEEILSTLKYFRRRRIVRFAKGVKGVSDKWSLIKSTNFERVLKNY